MLDRNRLILYFDRAIVVCLCLLIFCLPFAKAGVETFTWLALALWILKRALGYRGKVLWRILPKTELNKALLIFTIANIVSIIFCADTGLFLRGFFGKELKFLSIYFMLVEVINNKKRLLSILITLVVSAVLIIADASVQYYTGTDFLRSYSIDKHGFGASFLAASGFAAWLIVIIPLFLGIIFSNIIQGWKAKILLSLLVIIQSAYLLMTYTRGAWLGFLIAILFMLFYFIRKFALINKVLFLVIGVYLLMLLSLLPRFLSTEARYEILTKFRFSQNIIVRVKSIPQINKGSNLERIRLWKEALRIIQDYPITGCGLNNYSIVARNYKSFEGGGIYPHNSFLQKTAETGIFGLFAFLFIVFQFFKTGIRYLNMKSNYLVLGLLAGILAFLTQSFFDVSLYSLQLIVLFWYMLGLTMAIINLETDPHQNS